MAKKRKASGNVAKPDNSNGWGESGGKMKPIKSYEDVADSEDEFHMNRDKIMLDDGPDAKRRRKWQEEGMQSFKLLETVTDVQVRCSA
jgi:U3 small nucleolar RNA-associated protein 3